MVPREEHPLHEVEGALQVEEARLLLMAAEGANQVGEGVEPQALARKPFI